MPGAQPPTRKFPIPFHPGPLVSCDTSSAHPLCAQSSVGRAGGSRRQREAGEGGPWPLWGPRGWAERKEPLVQMAEGDGTSCLVRSDGGALTLALRPWSPGCHTAPPPLHLPSCSRSLCLAPHFPTPFLPTPPLPSPPHLPVNCSPSSLCLQSPLRKAFQWSPETPLPGPVTAPAGPQSSVSWKPAGAKHRTGTEAGPVQ